jgi:hypothetical protein
VLREASLRLTFDRVLRGLPVLFGNPATAASALAMIAALVLFAWKSPAPPSFATEWDRFELGDHATTARSFVDMVPGGVKVSAQSNYLPHLTHREHLYEFPRVLDAEYVLLDRERPIPGYSVPGFEDCIAILPRLGFERARDEDGITLWQRPPEKAREAPPGCSP